jgi:phosphoglycolate phosphatase-like HAD superfamily hydrolase
MKIGIDFDGTIADTNALKAKWLREQKGIIIAPWLLDRTNCIEELEKIMLTSQAKDTYEELSKVVYNRENTLLLTPIAGALEAIARLSSNNELFMITARSTKLIDSLDWLKEKNALKYFKAWYSSNLIDKYLERKLSKQEICEVYGMNILIDDDQRHLNKINIMSLNRILLKNGLENSGYKDGIYVAKNWDDVLWRIEEIKQNN